MSLKGKIENLLSPKKIAGVEVCIGADGNFFFHLVVLKKEKGKIITEQSTRDISAIDELKTKIPASVPICIVINGKGIIHRKIATAENDTEKTFLQKALPGADPKDFYSQKVKSTGSDYFVSVIRKSVVDDIFSLFSGQKFDIINISLGPFVVSTILPFIKLESDYTQLKFMHHGLVINAGVLESYSVAEDAEINSEMKIGDERIPGVFACAFASAFAGLLGDRSIALSVPAVQEAGNEFRQKKIFQSAGATALVFFLVVLLCNYFVFDYYWKKKQTLDLAVSGNEDAFSRYEALKKEFDTKNKFVEQNGLLGSSRVSFYADRIALNMPQAIQLSGMNIYPVERKNNDAEEKISFRQKQLRISGSSGSSTELNEWIKVLKAKYFIGDVLLAGYSQEKEKKTGSFVLEVKLR